MSSYFKFALCYEFVAKMNADFENTTNGEGAQSAIRDMDNLVEEKCAEAAVESDVGQCAASAVQGGAGRVEPSMNDDVQSPRRYAYEEAVRKIRGKCERPK